MTDSQKIKTMDFIQTLTAGKINFEEAFAYIYLTEKNKNIRHIISQINGMKEVISKLEKIGLNKNSPDLFNSVVDALMED